MNIKPTLFDKNYYWHHQNQLQQSALTFQALVEDRKKPVAPNLNRQDTEVACDKVGPGAPLATTLVITIESQVPSKIGPNHVDVDVDALVSHVNNQLLTPVPRSAPEASTPSTALTKTMAERIKALTQAPIAFKHHHVFMNEHAIELTLNTHALSRLEASALQRTIKQWLIQNGYALKTFIINGVQQ